MEIVKLSKIGKNLLFTAVDRRGQIKIGILPVSQANKRKPEWFTPTLKV